MQPLAPKALLLSVFDAEYPRWYYAAYRATGQADMAQTVLNECKQRLLTTSLTSLKPQDLRPYIQTLITTAALQYQSQHIMHGMLNPSD